VTDPSNPFRRTGPDPDVLAEALRAYNVRHNADDGGWESTSEKARDMWRQRARAVVREMARVERRRSRG
jgi:hypothetical protein